MLSLATFLRCLQHRICSRAQLRTQRPECGFSALGQYAEAIVEPRQELLQHGVGFLDGGRTRQAKLRYQAVLKSSRRSLHSTFRLWRLGEYHLNPQLVHGPAELGCRTSRHSTGRMLEDTVSVGVEGQRYAAAPHQSLG